MAHYIVNANGALPVDFFPDSPKFPCRTRPGKKGKNPLKLEPSAFSIEFQTSLIVLVETLSLIDVRLMLTLGDSIAAVMHRTRIAKSLHALSWNTALDSPRSKLIQFD